MLRNKNSQTKWLNYSKFVLLAFQTHWTVSVSGQIWVGAFITSHACPESTPPYILTYRNHHPTTYHYGHILSMDDCPAHLELIIVKSQPGVTEWDFRPSVHNGPTAPKVSTERHSDRDGASVWQKGRIRYMEDNQVRKRKYYLFIWMYVSVFVLCGR